MHATVDNLILRWILPEDVAALQKIAEQCPILEWSRDEFQECFRASATLGRIALVEGMPVGFVVYLLDRSMKQVFIKNLAVAPEWHRHGVGLSLLRTLDPELHRGYDRITALVPECCLGFQLLLRTGGYRAMRSLRGWYSDADAYLMVKESFARFSRQPMPELPGHHE